MYGLIIRYVRAHTGVLHHDMQRTYMYMYMYFAPHSLFIATSGHERWSHTNRVDEVSYMYAPAITISSVLF